MKPQRRNTGSADWSVAFLTALSSSANVRASCKRAGVSRKVAYERRANDPEFAQAWAEALEDGVDVLEAAARKRALDSSDTLLIFLLKSHRSDVYGDKVKVDIHQAGPTTVREVVVRTRTEAQAILKLSASLPPTLPGAS